MPLKLSQMGAQVTGGSDVDVDVVPEIPSVAWAVQEAKEKKVSEQKQDFSDQLTGVLKQIEPIMKLFGLGGV